MDDGEGCDDGNTVDDDDCLNNCQLPICGDSKVHPGSEQCDDGNKIDTDACIECVQAVCGDGVTRVGAEQCDDGNGVNTDDCKLDCTAAVCGDGVAAVLATVPEACDDGNDNEMDGCTSMCTTTMMGACGNKVVEGGEDCDDGNMVENDTCTTACKRGAYYVFVTSGKWSGNLGGLAGADTKCAAAAASASLPGKYKAWLSAGNSSALERLAHPAVPYIRIDNVVVATSWDGLVSKDLSAPINRTEKNMLVAVMPTDDCDPVAAVWTGTQPNGLGVPQTCSDWTTAGMATGSFGLLTSTDAKWTAACQYLCETPARLYCVEQP